MTELPDPFSIPPPSTFMKAGRPPVAQIERPSLSAPTEKATTALEGMFIPVILFAVSVYFWDGWVVYPIKLLTVLFHELSHGLAAIATGGKIIKIVLTSDEGGLCTTVGGNYFIVLCAGYLGSLLWGAGILLIAAKTRYDRGAVQFLGALLILTTILWIRSIPGVVFGLSFGAAMLAFANKFGEMPCDVLLRYIGLTSIFYVILDIKSDLIDRSIPISDAYQLSKMMHLPDWLIGGAWFVLALFITYKVLASICSESPESSGNK